MTFGPAGDGPLHHNGPPSFTGGSALPLGPGQGPSGQSGGFFGGGFSGSSLGPLMRVSSEGFAPVVPAGPLAYPAATAPFVTRGNPLALGGGLVAALPAFPQAGPRDSIERALRRIPSGPQLAGGNGNGSGSPTPPFGPRSVGGSAKDVRSPLSGSFAVASGSLTNLGALAVPPGAGAGAGGPGQGSTGGVAGGGGGLISAAGPGSSRTDLSALAAGGGGQKSPQNGGGGGGGPQGQLQQLRLTATGSAGDLQVLPPTR